MPMVMIIYGDDHSVLKLGKGVIVDEEDDD